MLNLLFNPNGRLAPRPFLQGVILCTAATLILDILTTYGSQALQLLVFFMAWPYLCLFGKRLHDAGQSAWLYLAFLLGFGILHPSLTGGLTLAFSPEYAELQKELEQILANEGFIVMAEASQEYAPQMLRLQLIPKILSLLIVNAILGLTAAALPRDPNINKHGPPTGPGPAETFT